MGRIGRGPGSLLTSHAVIRETLSALAGAAALVCAGCGAATRSTASAPAPPTPPPAAVFGHRHGAARGSPQHRTTHPRRRPAAGLAYSTASNRVVQRQPAPGSCRGIGSGLYERPDPACTPGALNPAVTQSTIHSTICVAGWTETVRPPESITEQEKVASMAAYGDTGSLGEYEYDHFVPLELGGAPNDPRNLWPEPGASPNPKDTVEDALRAQVCDGQISLTRAQHEIVTNWTVLANGGRRPPRSPTSGGSGRAGSCTVTAAYSARYHDYDVYVHSNRPDETVTVTDGAGDSATWHTDTTGYADVYLRASPSASGTRITARVGAATCYGTL